jgi:hypothetical protein
VGLDGKNWKLNQRNYTNAFRQAISQSQTSQIQESKPQNGNSTIIRHTNDEEIIALKNRDAAIENWIKKVSDSWIMKSLMTEEEAEEQLQCFVCDRIDTKSRFHFLDDNVPICLACCCEEERTDGRNE